MDEWVFELLLKITDEIYDKTGEILDFFRIDYDYNTKTYEITIITPKRVRVYEIHGVDVKLKYDEENMWRENDDKGYS
jgi:hypothetical protein